MNRILNINDNEVSRFTISRTLMREGFEMIEAVNGLDGVQKTIEFQPDLVLCDIKLPDIDGYEVCRRIKTNPSTKLIPVVHITAHANDTPDRVESLELGAEAYLIYPVEKTILSATVRSLLRYRKVEQDRERLLIESEVERARLKAALSELETERLMREQFVNTLTHDLRTPLTVMKLQIAVMNRKFPASEVKEGLGRLTSHVNRADRMIQDLLDVALVRAGKELPIRRKNCELKAIAQEVVEQFLSATKATLLLNAPREVHGYWDQDALRRVIENLIQNAEKYGDVSRPITLSVGEEEGLAMFSVLNFGNPIPEKNIENLFLPFSRADEESVDQKTGWGLGLALVRGVVKAQGGRIKVTSNLENGTEFKIFLPKNWNDNN